MPFQSEKQRRYLHANHPEIAKRWERDYAGGGITRLGYRFGGNPHEATQGSAGAGQSSGGSGEGQETNRERAIRTAATTRTAPPPVTTGGESPFAYTKPPVKDYGPYLKDRPATIKAHRHVSEAAGKKNLKDFQNAIKSTYGGYGPYTAGWAGDIKWKNEGYSHLPKWGDKTEKSFSSYKDYGPHTLSDDVRKAYIDLGLVEDLSTKDYKPSGPSMDVDTGQWYDAKGNLIDNPNINPELASMVTPVGWEKSQKNLRQKLKDLNFDAADAYKKLSAKNKSTGLVFKDYPNALEPKEFTDFWYGKDEKGKDKPVPKNVQKDLEEIYKKYLAEGGVARKNYFHGGILDINESEEIISDDGNDIELTAYNAAFDEPSGVQSLFRAKDGGRTNYIYGGISHPDGRRGFPGGAGRPGYDPMPEGGSGADYGGPTTTTTTTRIPHPGVDTVETLEEQKILDSAENNRIKVDEFRALQIYKVLKRKDLTKEEKNKQLKWQWDQFNKTRKSVSRVKDAFALNPILGIVAGWYEGNKLKKEQEAEITKLEKQLDLLEDWEMKARHHSYDTPTQILEQRILDIQQPRTDEGDPKHDPVPIYDPVTGAVSEEYAQGDYYMSAWDRIKANQAKRAMLVEKGIIQDNPVVDESVTDITMQANSGGLANLFRVKNQY